MWTHPINWIIQHDPLLLFTLWNLFNVTAFRKWKIKWAQIEKISLVFGVCDEWFNELFYLEFIIERGLTKEWKLINEFLGKIMRIAIPWRNKIVICRNVSQHFPPSHLLYLSTWFLWNSISILKRRRRRSSRSQSKRKKDSEIREKLVKVLGFILGHFLHLFSILKR